MARKKFTDNGPALDILRNMGFSQIVALRAPADSFQASKDDGTKTTLKIHKSGTDTGTRWRHRYGISLNALQQIDAVVFFAHGETGVYIVPSSTLVTLHDSESSKAQITPSGQWVVNIHFDPYDRSIEPTNYNQRPSIGAYYYTPMKST